MTNHRDEHLIEEVGHRGRSHGAARPSFAPRPVLAEHAPIEAPPQEHVAPDGHVATDAHAPLATNEQPPARPHSLPANGTSTHAAVAPSPALEGPPAALLEPEIAPSRVWGADHFTDFSREETLPTHDQTPIMSSLTWLKQARDGDEPDNEHPHGAGRSLAASRNPFAHQEVDETITDTSSSSKNDSSGSSAATSVNNGATPPERHDEHADGAKSLAAHDDLHDSVHRGVLEAAQHSGVLRQASRALRLEAKRQSASTTSSAIDGEDDDEEKKEAARLEKDTRTDTDARSNLDADPRKRRQDDPRSHASADEEESDEAVWDVVTRASQQPLEASDYRILWAQTQADKGAAALADGMEWMLSRPNGGARVSQLVAHGSHRENVEPFAQTLARMAAATPDKSLGVLLVTTDHDGGPHALSSLMTSAAHHPPAASAIGQMLEHMTRTPRSSASLGELLDTLNAPPNSPMMARLFNHATRTSSGATTVSVAFTRLLNEDGGGTSMARWLADMTSTPEGAVQSAEFLTHLMAVDGGPNRVVGMLARAAASHRGARNILAALRRLHGVKSGFMRAMISDLPDAEPLVKFLINAAANPENAADLADLLSNVLHPRSRVALQSSLWRIIGRPLGERLLWRVRQSPALQAAVSALLPVDEDDPPDPIPDNNAAAEGGTQDAVTTSLRPSSPVDDAARESQTIRAVAARPVGGARTKQRSGGRFFSKDERAPRRKPRHADDLDADDAMPSQKPFRPADCYTEGTLLAARICGECGFRLTHFRTCLRCVNETTSEITNSRQRDAVAPPSAARPAAGRAGPPAPTFAGCRLD